MATAEKNLILGFAECLNKIPLLVAFLSFLLFAVFSLFYLFGVTFLDSLFILSS
jgi:hypothetical protein